VLHIASAPVHRTHWCAHMATLSTLLTATYVLQINNTKGTNCCVSIATTATRSHLNVTLFAHCPILLQPPPHPPPVFKMSPSLPSKASNIVCVTKMPVFTNLIIFIFSGSAAQRGLWHPRSRGFVITQNDAQQSVGLLWTSDQLAAEPST
jgi:hypothetical protein